MESQFTCSKTAVKLTCHSTDCDTFLAGNHNLIAKSLGYEVKSYRYWDEAGRKINFEGLLDDLRVLYPQ